MRWIKATVGSLPPSLQSGAPQRKQLLRLVCKPRGGAFRDDQQSHPLNMPLTQVVVNAVVKGALSRGHPNNLNAAKRETIQEASRSSLSPLPLPGLTDVHNDTGSINKRMGEGRGEDQGTGEYSKQSCSHHQNSQPRPLLLAPE